MRFGLLGPIEVIGDDGQPVALAGERERALLATLALAANQVVSTVRLVEALWGNQPPATAGNALQVQVSKLRKKLAGASDRQPLRTAPHGYVLTTEAGELDMECFEELARKAPPDLRAKSEQLRQALALWRGPALADVSSELLAGEKTRLDERRLTVLEHRIEADLALGHHGELVGELEPLVRSYPLREGVRAQLMLALYRSGRQADALASFSTARKVLADELGIDPSPELQALEVSILRHDADLAAPQPTGRHDLEVPPADDPDNNLPVQVSSFVGRERELAEVAALVGQSRLVTLTGVGGAGKTRLALVAAARLLNCFADGVWFVELAPLTDPQLVPAAVASALGVRDETIGPTTSPLIDSMVGRDVLLVVDNCEHLLDGCAELVHAILRQCPQVHVLATSRQPLRISGEQLYEVPSLEVPDSDADDVDSCEAVQLFLQRARDQRADFTLDERNRPTVGRLCRRLDGMPLAIELACGRLRSMTVNDIESRLDARFSLLTGGSRTANPRQRTLGALIDWSYNLLSESERAVLKRLSVFAGNFDLRAAERVGAGCGTHKLEAAELVLSLVDKSLVQTVPSSGSMRYRLLETVREYARARLRDDPIEEAAASDAHASWFVELAEKAAPHLVGEHQDSWLTRLEADYDNIRAAAAHLVDTQDGGDLPLRLVVALRKFWYHCGHATEALQFVRRALAGSESSDPERRAIGCVVGAELCFQLAELAAADEFAEQAHGAAAFPETSAINIEYVILCAWIAAHRGDHANAMRLADLSVQFARSCGDVLLLGDAVYARGYFNSEDLATGLADLSEALACYRAIGSQADVGHALNALGEFWLESGDLQLGRKYLEDAIGGSGPYSAGLRSGATLSLGLVTLLQGDMTSAIQYTVQGFTLYRQHGITHYRPYLLLTTALCLTAIDDDLETSARLHGANDTILEVTGHALDRFETELRREDLQRLRDALGQGVFDVAYEAGRAMPTDEALELARQRLALAYEDRPL